MVTEMTKAEILGRDDLARVMVEVPEWGDDAHVYVRTMTSFENDAWEVEAIGSKDDPDNRDHLDNFRARFCARVITDSKGNRLFDDSDVEALAAKSASAIRRIFQAGQKLNNISDEDIEEMEGNSDASPS